MHPRLLSWLKGNQGRVITSPREAMFKRKTKSYKLVSVHEDTEQVKITFINGSAGLPLHFWMFDRALDFIRTNPDKFFWLGAKVSPPYYLETVEGEIWKQPTKVSPYKVSPFICDFLVLVGLAEYGHAISTTKKRRVQGVRYSQKRPTVPHDDKMIEKIRFIQKNKEAIDRWLEEHEEELAEARKNYSWGKKDTFECIRERNVVSKSIILSRIHNNGGLDLKTLDKIIQWGFNRKFPLRDEEQAIEITKKAFEELDRDNVQSAALTLLKIKGVGISRATKILSLFDQENLCIFDSRVGNALSNLTNKSEKIILCPPGYGREYDIISKKKWAEQYQRMLWTVQYMTDYMNRKGYTYRAADIEMALFMMGK